MTLKEYLRGLEIKLEGMIMKYLLVLFLSVSFVFGAVYINNASAKELTTLNGIGVKKADAIMKYRKKHCFKTVEDLMAVKGVGPKFIKRHKNELKIGTCKR